MKAIHNQIAMNTAMAIVGNYKLKYNFESNSQLGNTVYFNEDSWEL
ncbi:hypothetical protein AAGV28_07990 [Flavobacterium sp. FZUC8N2.13]|uniref:Uncharacterized protein n=1 Tax=Flavobacterium zubiriense TaxID=3138075 RepID=A0ABV4TB28_9FLAO